MLRRSSSRLLVLGAFLLGALSPVSTVVYDSSLPHPLVRKMRLPESLSCPLLLLSLHRSLFPTSLSPVLPHGSALSRMGVHSVPAVIVYNATASLRYRGQRNATDLAAFVSEHALQSCEGRGREVALSSCQALSGYVAQRVQSCLLRLVVISCTLLMLPLPTTCSTLITWCSFALNVTLPHVTGLTCTAWSSVLHPSLQALHRRCLASEMHQTPPPLRAIRRRQLGIPRLMPHRQTSTLPVPIHGPFDQRA